MKDTQELLIEIAQRTDSKANFIHRFTRTYIGVEEFNYQYSTAIDFCYKGRERTAEGENVEAAIDQCLQMIAAIDCIDVEIEILRAALDKAYENLLNEGYGNMYDVDGENAIEAAKEAQNNSDLNEMLKCIELLKKLSTPRKRADKTQSNK